MQIPADTIKKACGNSTLRIKATTKKPRKRKPNKENYTKTVPPPFD